MKERIEFVNKFVADPEIITAIPDAVARAAAGSQIYEKRVALNAAGWPEPFTFKFILPGLINYRDSKLGIIYIQKQVLDSMAESFVGKPIINYVHREVTPEDVPHRTDGLITECWFDGNEGWYYARGFVWDDETKANCRNASYANSCAFTLDELGSGGEHCKMAYDAELIRGTYTHLAIVDNPRIEGAKNFEIRPPSSVALNQKEGTMKTLLKLWKNFTESKEVKNAAEVDPDQKFRVIDGEKVSLNDLVKADREEREESKKKADLDEAKKDEMGEDETIDVDGEKRTVKDMVASYASRKAKAAQNAAAEKERAEKEEKEKTEAKNALQIESLEKDHTEGKHAATVENCKPCVEAQNALEAKAKQDAEEKAKIEVRNALVAEHGDKHEEVWNAECPTCKQTGEDAFKKMKEAMNAHKPVIKSDYIPRSLEERAAEATKAHTK